MTECPSRSLTPLHAGGEGARTTVVCLRLVFSSPPPNRLLADLPRLLIVPGHATPALAAATSLFASEVTQPRAGSLALLGRMAEVLFIEVLRREGERTGCAQGSLKALADPQLARALGLMHEVSREGVDDRVARPRRRTVTLGVRGPLRRQGRRAAAGLPVALADDPRGAFAHAG